MISTILFTHFHIQTLEIRISVSRCPKYESAYVNVSNGWIGSEIPSSAVVTMKFLAIKVCDEGVGSFGQVCFDKAVEVRACEGEIG